MMEPSHYLPSEELKGVNYPEVKGVQEDLDRIFDFAMQVDRSVYEYISGDVDRIDLNSVAIAEYVSLCRSVCETLGNADRVCFDILLEVRRLQDSFQELLFLKRRFGDEYVGTPSPAYDADYGEEGGVS